MKSQVLARTKPLHSELSMTAGHTPQLQPAAVNRTAASARPSSPSQNSGSMQSYIPSLKAASLSLTESESENVQKAADILAAIMPTLLAAGAIRRARNSVTGEVLLVFPSTLWSEE